MSKTITSGQPFQNPQAVAVANGSLILTLSQAAEVSSGGGQVAPKVVSITLDANGKIPGSTTILANDELTPSGTTYTSELLDSGGNIIANFGQWSIVGASPIDLSLQTPTTTGASYPAPVLLNPAGLQTITGFPINVTAIQGPGFKFQQFTSNGTFTIPTGITQVKVTVVGGGGSGGTSNTGGLGSTGGGSGGAAIKWLTGLTPGNTLTVTVGAGGAALGAGTTSGGNSGAISTVASGTQTISTITGGSGGGGSTGQGVGGGTAIATSGGDINISPNVGQSGGGASNAGTNGGPGLFGSAGRGGSGGAALDGAMGGGGGGAAGTFASGNGGTGIIIFEWIN